MFILLLPKYCKTSQDGQEGHRGSSNFSHQCILFQNQSISLIIIEDSITLCSMTLSNQLGAFFFSDEGNQLAPHLYLKIHSYLKPAMKKKKNYAKNNLSN